MSLYYYIYFNGMLDTHRRAPGIHNCSVDKHVLN